MRLVGSDESREPRQHRNDPSEVETHRCRIYKVGPPTKVDPEGAFTALWDTLEEPYENEGKKMPKGELVAEVASPFENVVFDKIAEHKRRLKIVTCGHWGFVGA